MPHIAIPIRKVNRQSGGQGLATVEQDSPAEVDQRVFAVLNTRPGDRIDLPEFGTPGQAFRRGGADLAAVERSVALWVPDADVIALRESGRLAVLAMEADSLDVVRVMPGV